nr:extracellular solute-binding protein [Bacillus sp. FJAT-50079]
MLVIPFLLIGILSACGLNGNKEVSQPLKERVTIKLHTHGTEDGYAWKKIINAFEKEHKHIRIEVNSLSEIQDAQEALQKIDLAAASGEEMDVLMFTNTTDYTQRIKLDMLEPIDRFIEEEGFTFDEEYKVNTQMDGHYYGLPGKLFTWYVLINKDHLQEAGLKVPKSWTWEEYMEYAKQMTTEERFGTYFHGPFDGAWIEFLKLRLVSKETNAGFIKSDGTSNLDDPMYRKSLEMRLKMEKEDQSVFPYLAMISEKTNYRDLFFNQQISMMITGTWMNSEIGKSEHFPLDFELAFAPLPQNDIDQEGAYAPIDGDILSIALHSKHKKEAYEFIRWYSTKGLLIQGTEMSAWKQVSGDQMNELIDNVISKIPSEKVDKESFTHTLQYTLPPVLEEQLVHMYDINRELTSEFEKFILEKQSLNQTLENSQKIVQEKIDQN